MIALALGEKVRATLAREGWELTVGTLKLRPKVAKDSRDLTLIFEQK